MSPDDGAKLHANRVKTRSKHPRLAIGLSNVRIHCTDCNVGKSNRNETDWR